MKKILGIFMLTICMLFAACNSCHRENKDVLTYPVTGVNVEEAIKADNDIMTARFGETYRWYESLIDATNWIDETDTFDVKSVANIFAAPTSPNTLTVYMYLHTMDTVICDSINGLWVGDEPMNAYNPMKVNFATAYNKMMVANIVKPHTHHCVLRKEVGPVEVEPLYIFGNQDAQVYVNAITGNVTGTNPVFPDEVNENRENNDSVLEALGYAFSW